MAKLARLIAIFFLIANSTARGDDATDLLKKSKAATALVVLPDEKGSGSSFCIDRAGLFVTNAHVVKGVGPREFVTLVLNPAEPGERVLRAKVAVREDKADLAVLVAEKPADLTPLSLGDEGDLTETQQLTAFGYPFGQALALVEGKYPSISVNVVRVSALRRVNNSLEVIQIDSQVNPGNSGGPLTDAHGNVVGIIQATIKGGGINFAIPVGRLKELLATPHIFVDEPTIAYEKRHEAQEFSARVVQFTKNLAGLTVQLKLGTGPDARSMNMTPDPDDNARYIVKATPLEPQKGPARVPISVEMTSGALAGTTQDIALKFGERSCKLSELDRIDHIGEKATVRLKDGTELSGITLPSTKLSVDLGGASVSIELSRIVSLTVASPEPDPARVKYIVTALLDGKPLAVIAGELVFESAPGAIAIKPTDPTPGGSPRGREPPPVAKPLPLPTGKPAFSEEQLIVKLPEPFAKAVLGGAGRYFVFYLKSAGKVILLDTLSGDIAAEIPNVSEDVLLACGREKLMLVMPGQKLLQRWSLATFKREKVAPLPGRGTTRIAAMGGNSNGPLLLGAEDSILFDIDAMRQIPMDGRTIGAVGQYGYSLRVSADGSTFGGIVEGIGPVSYELMQVRGGVATVAGFESTSNANRWAQPSADGSLIFLPGGAVYSRQLWRCDAKWLEGKTLYATVDPRYFISVEFVTPQPGKPQQTRVGVCTTADCRIVHTFTGLPEVAPRGNSQDQYNTFYALHLGAERFFYIPWAGIMAALDWDNSRVILHKLDLIPSLEATGINYLFVDSVPPDCATVGRTLAYAIIAKSKSGGVKFSLETGPAGMTVSPQGLVQWNVPAAFPDETTKAIVSISDSGGEELLHAFELKLMADSRSTLPKSPAKP